MKRLLFLLLVLAWTANAQVPVTLAPVPRQQFSNPAGQPYAGGFIYSYAGGTTTPQATYADPGGVFQNTNPLVLDAGGRGTIWLNANQIYKLCLADANNVQQWCVDGIASIFGTANTFTQPQTFLGGGTLSGTWGGNPLFTGGPTFTGTATFNGQVIFNNSVTFAFNPTITGSLTLGGSLTATQGIFNIATGTPPFIVTSTTQVANLNASQLQGATWDAPLAIGNTTPASGNFNFLKDTTLTVGGCIQAGVAGSLTTPNANPCSGPSIVTFQTATIATSGSIGAGTPTSVGSVNITIPATGGPYRVGCSYTFYTNHTATAVDGWLTDGTITFAPSENSSPNATAFSPTLYANTVGVLTITVKTEGGGTYNVNQTPTYGGPNSNVQCVVMASN